MVASLRLRLRRPETLVVAAGVALVVMAWVLVPTYPNYDAYFHLDWGRQIVRGAAPSFSAYGAPTEHPLYVAMSALAALFGRFGERVLVLFTLLSWLALLYGTFRLGRSVFGWASGLAAAVLIGASFAFALYAAKAFVDMPFIALVVWAGALAADPRRRRPFAVMVALALAGLLRPEAWLLAFVWWIWAARGVPSRRDRVLLALLVAAAPLVWGLVDLAVTGDALYSLHSTRRFPNGLTPQVGRGGAPGELVRFLASTLHPPVAALGAVGVALALRRCGARHLAVPLGLLGGGVIGFFALAVAGQPVLPRYLTVPAVSLCVFAGYALLGWRSLEPGAGGRRAWRAAAAAAVVLGVVLLALTGLRVSRVTDELSFVRRSHDDLLTVVSNPAVTAARRCGALTFPTYRLVPDARWLLDVSDRAVAARTDPARRRGGPVVIVSGRRAVSRFGLAAGIRPKTNLHPRGSRAIAHAGAFKVWVTGCPRGG